MRIVRYKYCTLCKKIYSVRGGYIATMKETEMGWNAEKENLLKLLWGQGLSKLDIASRLGPGHTINSIVRKAFRLGLPPRSSRPVRPLQCATPVDEHEEKTSRSPTQTGRPVTFHDMESIHCRWPIGDPRSRDFRFCGKKRAGLSSYCEAHSRRALQPLAQKDKKYDGS
jgi:GcrA cell cycle regulator